MTKPRGPIGAPHFHLLVAAIIGALTCATPSFAQERATDKARADNAADPKKKQRMADWASMTQQQRREARANYQRARDLPVEEREARWKAYQSLTPEQRQALAERARPAGAPPAQSRSLGGRPRTAPELDAQLPKSNIVGMDAPLREPDRRSAARDAERARPGATTNLITRPTTPPPHQQTGLPKITATPGFVDKSTLLPQRGPQGAATRSVPAASVPNRKK